MTISVCLFAKTLYYPAGGGHLWVYLNWALGLQALGCRVIWLEEVVPWVPPEESQAYVSALQARLQRYNLAASVALYAWDSAPLPREVLGKCMDLEAATTADLLLNMKYGIPAEMVQRFRRSVLVDIDPGLLQTWLSAGAIALAPHDAYFTIGETVGQPDARFPDAGLKWQYTPPCVALEWWALHSATADAPFTTVSHWNADEWMEDKGEIYANDKRTGFLPFLDLPQHTNLPLELAIHLGEYDQDEKLSLQKLGWRVRHAPEVASTPWDYQQYIQQSRGEFSCVKPSCIRLANAWISDRTLCYLASGKPAVIQHTGKSKFLPDAAGLFRFRTKPEAIRHLETVAGDYEHQCNLARALAAEYFDAPKVVRSLLEKVLS